MDKRKKSNLNNNKMETEPIFNDKALLENGFIKLSKDNHPFFWEKPIPNRNPFNSTPEDTDIKIYIHTLYNMPQFAVVFPNGAILNFNPQSIEDLKKFEEMIYFYDCEY